MRFSVITPVLNSRAHLRRCVGSVKGQAIIPDSVPGLPAADPDLSVEHRIMDGGSTDGTAEWLHTIGGTEIPAAGDQGTIADAPYRLLWQSAPDEGMYDAINQGWKHARGDVLSWLNADEQYLPGTLSTVAAFFSEHPDVDMAFGDAIIIGPDAEPLAARREIPLRPALIRNGILYSLSCTLFFRRRLLQQGALAFDTQYRIAGDLDLILRLLDGGARCRHVPHYLSLFGVDGGNQSVDPKMEEESRLIRRRHGASRFRAVQRAVRLRRYLERWLSGCYRKDWVQYDFALDDIPTYRHTGPVRLGFRFTYDRVLKRLGKKA